MITRGSLVCSWRARGYLYGVAVKAGDLAFEIIWQTGLVQRRRQGCTLVRVVPATLREDAFDALSRAAATNRKLADVLFVLGGRP